MCSPVQGEQGGAVFAVLTRIFRQSLQKTMQQKAGVQVSHLIRQPAVHQASQVSLGEVNHPDSSRSLLLLVEVQWSPACPFPSHPTSIT